MNNPLTMVCPHCLSVNRIPRAILGDNLNCGACHELISMSELLPLNLAGLNQHVNRSSLPVLVAFLADWQGPSIDQRAVLEALTEQLEPEVRIAVIDADEDRAACQAYGVGAELPVLILLREGNELGRLEGFQDASELKTWVIARV